MGLESEQVFADAVAPYNYPAAFAAVKLSAFAHSLVLYLLYIFLFILTLLFSLNPYLCTQTYTHTCFFPAEYLLFWLSWCVLRSSRLGPRGSGSNIECVSCRAPSGFYVSANLAGGNSICFGVVGFVSKS